MPLVHHEYTSIHFHIFIVEIQLSHCPYLKYRQNFLAQLKRSNFVSASRMPVLDQLNGVEAALSVLKC